MAPPDLRLHLLFGFLGSGKTTLARRLLDHVDGTRTAIIVNEFGEVGIDGPLLAGRGVDMIELTSGCLCCTLKGSLLFAVEELRDAGARRVIVEATGVAQPEELLEVFADPSFQAGASIGPLVSVVDAARFARFRDMLGDFYLAQIEHADLVILNKIDLAPAAVLDAAQREVAALNPAARIEFAERCDVPLDELLGGPDSTTARRHDRTHHGAGGHDHGDHRHAPAAAFAVAAEGEYDLAALRELFLALDPAVWRAKGFVRGDGATWLVQYAMGQLEIVATAPRPHYNLVFIGRDMPRRRIEAALRAAVSRPT